MKPQTIKQPIWLYALFITVAIFSFTSCRVETKEKQPVYVEYYNNGDTLNPDMVCPYTRVVIDAKGLNKAMGDIEQNIELGSDEDCDSLLHCYTKTIY